MTGRVVVPEPGLAAGIPGLVTEPEGPEDVVLLRPADPGSRPPAGGAVGRALGAAVVLLPADRVHARWVAAVAAVWAGTGTPDLARSLQSLVSMLSGGDSGALIRRPAPDGTPAAALPLPLLARLTLRAWLPCPHCAGGGGVPRGACGGCGRTMEAAA